MIIEGTHSSSIIAISGNIRGCRNNCFIEKYRLVFLSLIHHHSYPLSMEFLLVLWLLELGLMLKTVNYRVQYESNANIVTFLSYPGEKNDY